MLVKDQLFWNRDDNDMHIRIYPWCRNCCWKISIEWQASSLPSKFLALFYRYKFFLRSRNCHFHGFFVHIHQSKFESPSSGLLCQHDIIMHCHHEFTTIYYLLFIFYANNTIRTFITLTHSLVEIKQ